MGVDEQPLAFVEVGAGTIERAQGGVPKKWLWLGICAKTVWLQTDGWRSG